MNQRPPPDNVLSADTVVVEESGRWIVYLDVILDTGGLRRKVGDYHDERRATHAARIFERNARKYIPRGVAE